VFVGEFLWEIADIGEDDAGQIMVSLYPGPRPAPKVWKVRPNATLDFDGWINTVGYPALDVIRSITPPPWTIDTRGWVSFPYRGTR
jgi:hypothetical protein